MYYKMLIHCPLVIVSDIKQDGEDTAVGNIWTIPRDERQKQTLSTQQAILKTSYALRTSLDRK